MPLPAPPMPRQQGQDQAVRRHRRQGDRLDDDHGGRGREPPNEDDGGQKLGVISKRNVEHQKVWIDRAGEQAACGDQRQDGQAGQGEVEGKDPSRAPDMVRRNRLDKADVELAGKTEDRHRG